ncbi:MAG TPA: DUF4147 domain-containing protein [Actinomycetota bacterium]|nr:DUF4147 domain-containing protein [Actinomycetota bacterium]
MRPVLVELFHAGVAAAAPGPALEARLHDVVPAPNARRIWVVAAGKAAHAMAEAAMAHLDATQGQFAGGLVIGPETRPLPAGGLQTLAGDHPIPGTRSAAAARALDGLRRKVSRDDEVWVLLSGGATSLAASPVDGVTVEELAALYRILLTSGLGIADMNAVRKRFSSWGAGRLAVGLHPARVRTFAISDVPGDEPAAVGSGPCSGDLSFAGDVRRILEEGGLWHRIPEACRDLLRRVESDPARETPKPDHPALREAEWHLVASNKKSVEGVTRAAAARGLRPVDGGQLTGEAAITGRRLAQRLVEMEPGTCLVAGGETVVTISGGLAGTGGRCQELALAAAEVLAGAPGIGLLAAGTDGRDGPTDAAGAVVDNSTWDAVIAAGRDPSSALAGHDSYPALESAGALLRTGLTGTNVMDLVIGMRAPA